MKNANSHRKETRGTTVSPYLESANWVPLIPQTREEENHVVIEVRLPRMTEQNAEFLIKRGRLLIRASRSITDQNAASQESLCLAHEAYWRSVEIPEQVEPRIHFVAWKEDTAEIHFRKKGRENTASEVFTHDHMDIHN